MAYFTTLQPTDPLAARAELYRQWRSGALTTEEYEHAFEQINAAHSHDTLCDNGDRRQSIAVIGGRNLCGACAVKAMEARA